jgi:hypothetical protein
MTSGHFCDGTSPHLTVQQFAQELTEYLRYIKLRDETKEYLDLQVQLLHHLSLIMQEIDRFFVGDCDETLFMQTTTELCQQARDHFQSTYPQLFSDG